MHERLVSGPMVISRRTAGWIDLMHERLVSGPMMISRRTAGWIDRCNF